MTQPDPGPFDADLSTAREGVEDTAVRVFSWSARNEPDPVARRAASDAIAAADRVIGAMHRIRAELITQTRQADDASMARAGQLLARGREGPPGATEARPPGRTSTIHADPPPAQGAKS
ncbi:MAG: hypothetical protein ACRDOC_11825 [Streptosporangiaceae bacterium]